jgi:drug/metabolite transporter (DMT)-like permease
MNLPRLEGQRLGLALTLGGVLCFTPDTLMLRIIGLDGLSLTAWRGAMAGLVILAGCLAVAGRGLRRALLATGWAGLGLAALQGAALLAIGLAVEHTTIGVVLVGLAFSPMLSAVMARVFLGERLDTATRIAVGLSSAGMLIVALGAIGGGDALGLVYALLNALLMAATYVVIRAIGLNSAVPFVGLGFLLAAAVTWAVAPMPPLEATRALVLTVNGLVILPLAVTLLSLGPRYLPAPEVAMITLLQTVLGSLLVWWALGENPGAWTIAGGSMIVATLAWHARRRMRAPLPDRAVA